MQFLKKPITILVAILAFRAYQVIFSFQIIEYPAYLSELRLVAFVVLAFIAFFAARDSKTALWIVGIYLLLTNIFTIVFGLIIPFHQYILKTVAIILGCYFTFGGVVLIKRALRLKRNAAEPPATDGQAAAP